MKKLAILLLLLPVAAHAQPACTTTAPNAPACAALAVSPALTDILFGQQATGPNRANQTVHFTLGQLLGAGLPIGSVTPGTGAFTTLGASGTATLLNGTGRDLTIVDQTTRARINVANGFPLWFGSHLELASTQTPQNSTELTLLGFSGNAITLSGSQTYQLLGGTATLNGATSHDLNINQITTQSAVAETGPNGLYNFTSSLGIVNGASGAHTAILGNVNIPSGTTGLTNMNPTGGQFETTVAANAGGISGTTAGYAYGFYAQAGANSGATFWKLIAGGEIDIGAQTGSSFDTKTGLQVVALPTDAVAGARGEDSAYVIGYGAGALGFDYGIRINGISGGFPIKTTGQIMGCSTNTPLNCGTVTNGINFLPITFTGKAFQSTGFSVDGSGNVTAASYKAGATAGVSCAANTVSLTTLVVTNGIVTHC
jgi:hypothetical protein